MFLDDNGIPRVEDTDEVSPLQVLLNTLMDGVSGAIDDFGEVPDVQVFTSSGTWTKPEGAKYVKVRVVGGGGGGGGAAATNSTEASTGGGGGAGGYSERIMAAADLADTVSVTVGSGGGTSFGGSGSSGDTSQFGTHATANGGSGGNQMISSVFSASRGGNGGSASSGGGGIAVRGALGGNGFGIPSDYANQQGGQGAPGPFGGGGLGASSPGDGGTGSGYGSGGGGAINNSSQFLNRRGGSGFRGVVVVETWF